MTPLHEFGWISQAGSERYRSKCLTCGWESPWVHDRRTARQAHSAHAAAVDPS